MIILGIESSFDETAAAIIVNGKIISNSVYSQEIHKKHGGVVPELASRAHLEILQKIIKNIRDKKIDIDDLILSTTKTFSFDKLLESKNP